MNRRLGQIRQEQSILQHAGCMYNGLNAWFFARFGTWFFGEGQPVVQVVPESNIQTICGRRAASGELEPVDSQPVR